jgi:ABC-2 type transport system permease protein
MFLKFVVPSGHPATLLYYVTGNVVLSLSLNPLFMLAGQLSWARQSKAFDFYAGLPISRSALILACVAISVLFTLPGMIVLLGLAMVVFHLSFVPSPLAAVVLLVSPIALSGLGSLIGVLAPSNQVAGVITNLTAVGIMFLSPIFTPASRLPGVLQVTSYLFPPT